MGTCVAIGCTNRTSKKIPGVTFHTFPKDEVKRRLWTLAVRRKNWFPTRSSRICSIHFPESMIDRTSTCVVRLRDNAVPTIFKAFPKPFKNKKLPTSSTSEDSSTTSDCLEAEIKSNELHHSDSSIYSEVKDIKQEAEEIVSEQSNAEISEQPNTEMPAELTVVDSNNQVLYSNRWPTLPDSVNSGQTFMIKVLGNIDNGQELTTSGEIYYKRKIDDLNNVIHSKNKQIKLLQQKVRRYTKRIENLRALFQTLKNQRIIDDEDLQTLRNIMNRERKSSINRETELEESETEPEENEEFLC